MAKDGAELRQALFHSVFSVGSLRQAATEFSALTLTLLGLPVGERVRDLLVWLSVVLEHLSERVTSAISLKVVESDLARDTLALDHVCLKKRRVGNDKGILLGCRWMLCYRHTLPHIGLLLHCTAFRRAGCRVGKLVDQGRGSLFGHSATRVR